jgi:hypothetical protein
MKRTGILILLCCMTQYISAQNFSQKFGKVTMDELEMTTYDKAPDAEAVILFENVEMYYDFANNINLVYDYRIKVKILKKEGTSWGDGKIILHNRGSADEFLSGLKASSYNLVDGKSVESELKKDYIFREKLDDKRTLVKFSIPEVKVGSVIEYKFRITSDYIFSIPDLDVQHSIPVIYSKFNVAVPEYFKFSLNVKGYHRLNIQREKGNYNSSGYFFSTDIVSCEAEHIPALKDDSYVWCLDDFKTKVEFELSSIQIPGQMIRSYSNTWKAVNETLEKSGFNSDLKTSYPFKKEVMAIKESDIGDKEKIRKILKLVQSKIKCNEKYALTSSSPRQAAEKGTGTSADINFVLHSALLDAGFDAVPILLNPRRFGRLPLAKPTVDKINAFIVRVTLNGEDLYLDGAHPHSDINVLSPDLLVDKARIYKVNDNSGWVNLTNLSQNVVTISVLGNINDENELSGTIRRIYTNQAAYSFASSYEKYNSKEEYIEAIEKEFSINVSDVEIKNIDSTVINETILFTSTISSTDEYLYLNSTAFPFMSENTLKQQERILPVEFNYPVTYNINCGIILPSNYSIEEKPENITLSACENGVKYRYISQIAFNNLQIKFSYALGRPIFTVNEYTDLSSFYGMLTQMSNSQIVIKKNQ